MLFPLTGHRELNAMMAKMPNCRIPTRYMVKDTPDLNIITDIANRLELPYSDLNPKKDNDTTTTTTITTSLLSRCIKGL